VARRKKHAKRPAPKRPAAKPHKTPARKKRTVAHAASNQLVPAPNIGGELPTTLPVPYAPGYKAPREAQAKPSGPEPPDRTPLIRYSGKTLGSTGTALNARVTAMKTLRATHIRTPKLIRRSHVKH
jgi:hypothetical protein